MPKQAVALSKIPPQMMHALETLGSHLAVARVRRKESLATRATALWLIGRDGELARIASPEHDKGPLEVLTGGRCIIPALLQPMNTPMPCVIFNLRAAA